MTTDEVIAVIQAALDAHVTRHVGQRIAPREVPARTGRENQRRSTRRDVGPGMNKLALSHRVDQYAERVKLKEKR